jgi:chromosome segregation ATPase
MKIQISDQNKKIKDLFDIKNQLEVNLEHAKSRGNENDRHKLNELENQIQILTNDFNNSRKMLNQKNEVIEEKNKTIEFLSTQNNQSNNSYELFENRFNEMESKKVFGRF